MSEIRLQLLLDLEGSLAESQHERDAALTVLRELVALEDDEVDWKEAPARSAAAWAKARTLTGEETA